MPEYTNQVDLVNWHITLEYSTEMTKQSSMVCELLLHLTDDNF